MFFGGPMDGMPADAQGLSRASDSGLVDLQQLAAQAPPDGAGAGGEPGEELSESQRFDRMLSDALALAQGDMSEQNKAVIQDIMSRLQRIKASEEKEDEQAMSGKFSPGAMRRALGA